MIGWPDLQIPKEDLVEFSIVILAGMNEQVVAILI
jgi:hypothetical protein